VKTGLLRDRFVLANNAQPAERRHDVYTAFARSLPHV
jgi:hypothetical protein